jgi:hypothetical protein
MVDKESKEQKQQKRLEHSQGGITTRDDANDLGVDMLPGHRNLLGRSSSALRQGPKRGDYSQQSLPPGYEPMTSEPIPNAKSGEPQVRMVRQRPNAQIRGDVPKKKGGVDTSEEDR